MFKEYHQTVGERVKFYREQLGLTQEQLGKMIGYNNRSAIYNIENNRCGIPYKKIKPLADILGVSAEDLLGTSPDQYLMSQKQKRYSHVSIDLSEFSEGEQQYLSELLNDIVTKYKKHRLDEIAIYNLSDYTVKKRELLKSILDAVVEQFN